MKAIMSMRLFTLAGLLLALTVGLRAADAAPFTPEAGSRAEQTSDLSWGVVPDPSLPNVLLLGDSISIGYTLQVRKILQGKANIFRPVTADGSKAVNCEGTTAGVKQIDGWLAGQKWDVIHFNWGLHDLKHVVAEGSSKNSDNPSDPVQATIEQYSRNLDLIAGKLKATGARLIFATTTPVAPGTINPPREPDAPARYNAAAKKLMEAYGIRVNDLFGLCEPQLQKLQLPRNVHFTKAGSEVLALQVAAVIEEELAAANTGKSQFKK
jgi:lysophospholipase L1-like esterase